MTSRPIDAPSAQATLELAAPGAPAGTIVFCPANGFTASTYGTLFAAWRAAGWQVLAHEKFGHTAQYPVTSGWPRLRDELLDFLDRHSAAQPVVLVGHSMGGYLSLLAASRRPASVRGVVLLDSPIVAGWRTHAFKVLKATGLIHRGGPGRIAARRRNHWADEAAVRAHFSSKAMFRLWDPRVFDDYVRHGFEAAPEGGLRLAFHREVETRIYNTLPHHVQALLRRQPLRCPVSFVSGTRSVENRQLGLRFVKSLAGERWRDMDGTHLFPMEQPEQTARTVLELIGAPEA